MADERRPIVFFEASDVERREFETCGCLPDHPVVIREERLTPETVHLAADGAVVSVFIYSRLTADVLSRMPQLRLVATRSTGHDHIGG